VTKQTGKSGIVAELHVSHDSYDIPTHCFLPMIQYRLPSKMTELMKAVHIVHATCRP